LINPASTAPAEVRFFPSGKLLAACLILLGRTQARVETVIDSEEAMKKIVLPLLVAAAILSSGPAQAQSTADGKPRLVIRSGVVEVLRDQVWQAVKPGELLNAGERVRTANGATAAIELERNKIVTLEENSEVEIQLVGSAGAHSIRLDSGSMKAFSPPPETAPLPQDRPPQTAAQTSDKSLDLELDYQGDSLRLSISDRDGRSSSVTIRGAAPAMSAANRRPAEEPYYYPQFYQREQLYGNVLSSPTYYVYPFQVFSGRPDPNEGRIVPPVVTNPTNPGYRPTQIVPPMSDPIRVPVSPPVPFGRR
jgi:hypothetical protein